VISVIQQASIPWFYSSNTTKAKLSARLAELTPIYKAYTDIGGRIGQVLEIAVYRALSMMPDAKFFGRYLNLDEHDDSTMYKKEEPPQHIGVREGQPRASTATCGRSVSPFSTYSRDVSNDAFGQVGACELSAGHRCQ
jgi:hypothetical protein